ncbi:MAG TPA: hypothetical protein VE931_06355 [Pyrinomonadaceae bacterium]|nr:hypothetical protein [Pyrinomonadaceae bacterium]
MKFVLLMLLVFTISAEGFSRSGATTQRGFNHAVVPLRRCVSNLSPQTGDISIEVFQVLDLPLSIHQAALTKSERGHFLQLSLSNSSDLKVLGLRYSLASIDARNQLQIRVNRTEGFSLPAYDMKTLTFKTPIKIKQKDGERLLLMIEQVISRESIWEVVTAKDALEAYARGDFSVVPTVLRIPNQVDSPPVGRGPIYFRRN